MLPECGPDQNGRTALSSSAFLRPAAAGRPVRLPDDPPSVRGRRAAGTRRSLLLALQLAVVAVEQLAPLAAKMHAAALAVAEHVAGGACAAPRPFAVAERFEAVQPHLPEPVAVDVALVVVGPDRGAARNRAVGPDRGHRNPGGTLVEAVADLGFVFAQKPFAGIADVDPALAARAADEFQHPAEIVARKAQRRVVLGTSHREDREDPPGAHPFGEQQLPELLQMRHQRLRDAGHHVERHLGPADDRADRAESPGETLRVPADAVVQLLEAVEAHGDAPQSGADQRFETFGGERQTVGDHSPRIAAARHFASGPFEVGPHEHLAARKDDEHRRRVRVRRDLLVQHAQEVVERHVPHPGIGAAVAAAVAAREVAAQRALPEERVEPVFGGHLAVKIGK